MILPFLGGSSPARSANVSVERTINWYPARLSSPNPKIPGQVVLYPTPGMQSWSSFPAGIVRGLLSQDDQLYAVQGGTFWTVASDGTPTSRGSGIANDGEHVTMDTNGDQGRQVFVAGAGQGWIYDMTLGNITRARFNQVAMVTPDTPGVSASGGGSLSVGTYACALVAVDINGGLSLPGNVAYVVAAPNDKIVFSYVAPAGAVSMRIYVSDNGATDPDRYFATTNLTTYTVSTLSGATMKLMPTVSTAYSYGDVLPVDYGGFIDGYFVALDASESAFYVSSLFDGMVWDAADKYVRNTASDRTLMMLVVRGQLWLFGSRTTDVWYNSGDATTPFVPIAGALMQYGILAPRSAAICDNAPIWLSQSKDGQAMVLRGNGYQPQRISTDEIEWFLQSYDTLNDAVAWVYQESGHTFYVLTFPTEGKTWVYDASTNFWHERGERDTELADWTAYRPTSHVFAFGKHLAGDEDGNILWLTPDLYTDMNGALMRRMRQGQHICREQNWQFVHRVQVDVETGIGTTAYPDPTLSLSWSDDGGHTWTVDHSTNVGPVGSYRQRAIWRNLGRSRDRVWRLTCSDPVPWIVMGFYADMSEDGR